MKKLAIVIIFLLLPGFVFGQGLQSRPQIKGQSVPQPPPASSRKIDPKKPLAQPQWIPSQPQPKAKPAPPPLPVQQEIDKLQSLLAKLKMTSDGIQERMEGLRRRGFYESEESVAPPPDISDQRDIRKPQRLLPSNREYINQVLEKVEKITADLEKDLRQAEKKLSQARPGDKVNPAFVDYLNDKLDNIKKELGRLAYIYNGRGERYLSKEQKAAIKKILADINQLEEDLTKLKNQPVNPRK